MMPMRNSRGVQNAVYCVEKCVTTDVLSTLKHTTFLLISLVYPGRYNCVSMICGLSKQ